MENGKKRTFLAHRLVLKAFNPIDDMENLEVNHKDGNKKNNNLDNLEWVTTSENQRHAFLMGLNKPRKGEKNNFAKLTENDIKKIFEMRAQGKLQKDIAKEIGCTPSNISYILSKKTWRQ